MKGKKKQMIMSIVLLVKTAKMSLPLWNAKWKRAFDFFPFKYYFAVVFLHGIAIVWTKQFKCIVTLEEKKNKIYNHIFYLNVKFVADNLFWQRTYHSFQSMYTSNEYHR